MVDQITPQNLKDCFAGLIKNYDDNTITRDQYHFSPTITCRLESDGVNFSVRDKTGYNHVTILLGGVAFSTGKVFAESVTGNPQKDAFATTRQVVLENNPAYASFVETFKQLQTTVPEAVNEKNKQLEKKRVAKKLGM